MANTFAPNGFQLAGFLDGRTGSLGQAQYTITSGYSSNIYSGDPVSLSSGTVIVAASGTSAILGIFIGCEYYNASVNAITWSPYWPASTTVPSGTAITAQVIIDPQATFKVQTSGTSAAAISNINTNFDFAGQGTTGAAPTAQALTGQSAAYLNLATSGSNYAFRLLSLVTAPPGANGTDTTTPYNYVIVGFNNQTFRAVS